LDTDCFPSTGMAITEFQFPVHSLIAPCFDWPRSLSFLG
jgi:hypothetical protein